MPRFFDTDDGLTHLARRAIGDPFAGPHGSTRLCEPFPQGYRDGMAIRETMSVSIGPASAAVAEAPLASGRWGDPSEVMRAAPRRPRGRELESESQRGRRIGVQGRHARRPDA